MNILMLTSVYKDKNLGKEDKSTDIVNSFVYSWSEQGHNVLVIHNVHRYPRIIHEIPKSIKAKIAKQIGFQFGDFKSVQKNHYEDQGVDVWKLPILKIIPHGTPSKFIIKSQAKKIDDILTECGFKPDVMVGHWASPQMEIMYELLEKHKCRSAIVLHGTGYINSKNFEVKKYLSRIEKIGCRSKTQSEIVKEMLGLQKAPFVCYSGIPDSFLDKFQFNGDKFQNINKWKFVYAGRLVSYKRIDTVIKALAELNEVDWQLDIVGEGAAEAELSKLAYDCGVSDKVIFHGRVTREEVIQIMSEAHCFVMVSKGEIFGLVYLEAMAASCITVGSRKEGIDGILVDGENGYLCEPGDIEGLKQTIKTICNAGYNNNISIALKGYSTAHNFSDTEIAERYLECLNGEMEAKE